ncbi:MAG: (Fe-S)-binding protein [Candidatus Hodarchaeota archaeon]
MGTINALNIYKLLPGLNCKKCKAKMCMPFAVEILKGSVKPEDCPPLMEPKYSKKLEELRKVLAPFEEATETGIVLHEDMCDGCGVCVIACPVNPRFSTECLSGKAPMVPLPREIIYALEDGKSRIINIENCRRYTKEHTRNRNCRVCEIYCPRHAIEIKI